MYLHLSMEVNMCRLLVAVSDGCSYLLSYLMVIDFFLVIGRGQVVQVHKRSI